MLSVLAVVVASVAGQPTLNQDPSLAPAAACGMPTVTFFPAQRGMAADDGMLLSYDGVVLKWDDVTEEFLLTMGNNFVSDLVTSTDSRGWRTFSGLFSNGNPTVYGSVDDPDAGDWVIELHRPGQMPERFEVKAISGVAVVTKAENCDCADRIGLECNSVNDCNNGKSCSAGTSTCKLRPALVVERR